MATVLRPEQYGPSAVDDFKHELRAARRRSVIDHRYFILASRIARWLRAPPDGRATPDGSSNARRILEALYGPDHGRPDEINWLLDHMKEDNTHCWLRIFTILLQMEHSGQNMGKHIHAFFQQKILDTSIGHLTKSRLEPMFRNIGFSRNDSERLATEFLRLQWELCTREALDKVFGRSYDFGKDWIIPVTKKVLLKEGGTGTLYIVEVPSECVPMALEKEIEVRQYIRYNEDGTEGEVSHTAILGSFYLHWLTRDHCTGSTIRSEGAEHARTLRR